MKVFKYIVSVLLILSALGGIFTGDFLTGLFFLILGIIIFPPISDNLKEKFKFWQNKAVRYVSYIALVVIAGAFIDKSEMNKGLNETTKDEVKIVNKDAENKVRYVNLDETYYDGNMKKVEPDDNDVTYKVVEVLKHDKNKGRIEDADNEIITLLIEVSSEKEQDLKEITNELKKQYAQFTPNNCFLDVWDDKKAYELYLEREKFIQKSYDKLLEEFQRTRIPIGDKLNELKLEWDKKNYPFIADHNLTSSDFSGLFDYFPLQDDYYKEVGGKNFKK